MVLVVFFLKVKPLHERLYFFPKSFNQEEKV